VRFRGTAYHNTVLVDGRNQTRYGPGRRGKFKIQGPAPKHELVRFVSEEGFDLLHGIARSHEYEAVHERKIFFIAGAYWIIWDLLHGAEAHDYDQLFHLSDRAMGRTRLDQSHGTVAVSAPGLVLARAAAPDVSAAIGEGFVSRVYGEKAPAPIVRFSCRARAAGLHAVLYPYRARAPEIRVSELPVSEADGGRAPAAARAVAVSVREGGRRVTDIAFTAPGDGALRRFAGYGFDGDYLLLRLDADGRVIARHAPPGAALTPDPAAPTAQGTPSWP